MAQRIKIKPLDSISELRLAIKKSNDESQKSRLRAILSIKEGLTHTEAAKQFVVCRTTIVSWVAAYNRGGIKALKMSQGGRPSGCTKWDVSLFEALIKEIDKGGKCWSVPLMCSWIKNTYEKDVPEQTVWFRLRLMKYSYKSARPHPCQGDDLKQEAFKKGVSKSRSRH